MRRVTIVDHPLVQHKLTLLRDKSRSTKSFRELCRELGILMCYEVTRDLPLGLVEIDTPMARRAFDDSRVNALVPMQRMGTPEEVAAVVAFLASESASYVSGETISVNGAMYS